MHKIIIGLLALFSCSFIQAAPDASQPNILLVLTDDQGWGDLGCHENPHLKTPNIDRFATEGIEFTRFYVSPVCAPTRASLMTGRYNYRTGVTDTWFGRATMATEEFTLAEALKAAGYATGLFGKWHLGDTYPYRPEDQGFDEVLMHRGGGIAQPSCPLGNSYFDPQLLHNGTMKSFSGYCMDIYTDAAIAFIENNKNKPFFAYLATNTPHSPLQVSDAYADLYRAAGIAEETAKIYGMITNIDDNFGRLMKKLDELNIAENTLVIFMSDNGPKIFNETRHTGGLRGQKATIYEGGLRVPFFIRWPEQFKAGRKIETIAAHIDLMPTLLEASGTPLSENVEFDGLSLMPLMQSNDEKWPERTLFFQWHRGDAPALNRNFAAVEQHRKLVQQKNQWKANTPIQFELYDLQSDPTESTDLAQISPETVEQLRGKYETWFSKVCAKGFNPSPAWIGTPHENPVVLTQQDRRDADGWGNDRYYPAAFWPVLAKENGTYSATLRLYAPLEQNGKAIFRVGGNSYTATVPKGSERCAIKNIPILKGEYELKAWIETGHEKTAPHFLELERTDR